MLDRLEPHNAQGELYVTDTLGLLVADGETVAVHTAPIAWEVEGINTRVELAFVAAKLRDRINEAHMLAGVTIVDPASTWIEVGVEIEPDVTIHPFTVLRGRRRAAPRSAARRRVDAATGRRHVGPFAYLRPGTVLGEGVEDRHVRRAEEVARRRPDEDPAPLLHRRRRDRRGYEHRRRQRHRELPPRAGRAEGPNRRSAATSGPASTMRSVHLSTLATTLGLHRVRSSPMMSPPDRSPGSLRARKQRKGGSTRSMESLTGTAELTLPGLEGAAMTEPSQGHWIERGPQKRLMVFSRPLAPRPRERDRRAPRPRARRHRARDVQERRDVLRGTSSRSAAPTSSSCRRAASRSTST